MKLKCADINHHLELYVYIYTYLLNNLKNLNEISRKKASYNNIKSHKTTSFPFFTKKYIFRKTPE